MHIHKGILFITLWKGFKMSVLEAESSLSETEEEEVVVYKGITEIKIITKTDDGNNSKMAEDVNHYLQLDLENDVVGHTDFMAMSLQNIETSKDILSRAKFKMNNFNDRADYKTMKDKPKLIESTSFDCDDASGESEETTETAGDAEAAGCGSGEGNERTVPKGTQVVEVDNGVMELTKDDEIIEDSFNSEDDWLLLVKRTECHLESKRGENTRTDKNERLPTTMETKRVRTGTFTAVRPKSSVQVRPWVGTPPRENCVQDQTKYRNMRTASKHKNVMTSKPARIVNYDFNEAEQCRNSNITAKHNRKESLSRGLAHLRRHSVSTDYIQEKEKSEVSTVRSKVVQRLAQTRPKMARSVTFPSIDLQRALTDTHKGKHRFGIDDREPSIDVKVENTSRVFNVPIHNLSNDTHLPLRRSQERKSDNFKL